jgi:hypothetical protein
MKMTLQLKMHRKFFSDRKTEEALMHLVHMALHDDGEITFGAEGDDIVVMAGARQRKRRTR